MPKSPHHIRPLIHPFWVKLHFLGLDAPIVAIAWQAIWGVVLASRLQWFHTVILFSGTWALYLADRYLDSRKIPEGFARQARHDFAGVNPRLIVFLVALALAICSSVSLLMLSTRGALAGCLFALLTGAYMVGIHQRRWAQMSPGVKEAGVALLFTCGTTFFPFIWHTRLHPSVIVVFLNLFLLCFANCLLISFWEEKKLNQRFIQILCLTIIILSFGGTIFFKPALLLILQGVVATHYWILSRKKTPTDSLAARVLIDRPLLLPFLFYLVSLL